MLLPHPFYHTPEAWTIIKQDVVLFDRWPSSFCITLLVDDAYPLKELGSNSTNESCPLPALYNSRRHLCFCSLFIHEPNLNSFSKSCFLWTSLCHHVMLCPVHGWWVVYRFPSHVPALVLVVIDPAYWLQHKGWAPVSLWLPFVPDDNLQSIIKVIPDRVSSIPKEHNQHCQVCSSLVKEFIMDYAKHVKRW
jgi:hypothetical protein